MIVYLYDFNGLPLGEYQCQLDKLESELQEKEVYLIPANCTETPPPQAQEGETVRFVDGQWTIEKQPEPNLSEPPKPQPTIEDLKKENELLKAQIQAQSDRNDFMEDCIAEIAMQLYN